MFSTLSNYNGTYKPSSVLSTQQNNQTIGVPGEETKPVVSSTYDGNQLKILRPQVVPRAYSDTHSNIQKTKTYNASNGLQNFDANAWDTITMVNPTSNYDSDAFTGFSYQESNQAELDTISGMAVPSVQTLAPSTTATTQLTSQKSVEKLTSLAQPAEPSDQYSALISNLKSTLPSPPKQFLIPKSDTNVYYPEYTTPEERSKYFSNIQPSAITYSDSVFPINNNIAITQLPKEKMVIKKKVMVNGDEYEFDQVVDKVPDEDIKEQYPSRKYASKYDFPDSYGGVMDTEDVYDPRMTSYGDSYRSYYDANLGNTQYWYGDIDAYRTPNFSTRTNVDFIKYTDPQGREISEYHRNVGLQDVRKEVEDTYTADQLYFRQDHMERIMRKRNSESWQLKLASIPSQAHRQGGQG